MAMTSAILSADEFELFARMGRLRHVRPGEMLFRRGDSGTVMYVISRGEIDLDFGDDLQVKRLGPNEFFGELGLLIGDHARSADAIAVCEGELIELRHEEFERLVDQDPATVSFFLRRAIMRVVYNEQGLIRRLRRRNHDLQAALDSLHTTTHQLNQTEELVRTDELTGLYNRRGLMLHMQECREIGMTSALGLVLVDCDRFKQVNDEYGHLVGDRVLQSVASILRAVVGPEDLACRLGGDEFCLVVASGQRDDVMRVASYVARTAQDLLALGSDEGGTPIICPLSVGACLVEADADWNAWYAQADAALYRAKRLGGGRVEWQDPLPSPA
ncbi:GGDEF domain-containing protein [Marilutibacter chinensis]|uniref:diguanylate cyclase n=1 Tax=Marilutibacter chinensis TaxID=2912247 RepID=A0ABS9HVA1_9GAMM|nr:GGDEF domain-containing protein [Lysobacter chinensis]MCF7222824.1 GGDEF domain-containing protein [Lysobacter chinensis]